MLPPERYSHVFSPFRGAKVSFHRGYGNVGDDLIVAATFQLFAHYDITISDNPDVVMFTGGGNMGPLYPHTVRKRREAYLLAKDRNVPFVVLPQSWNGPEDVDGICFARETESLRYCPDAVLAPDLALAYRHSLSVPVTQKEGLFFRTDKEATFVPENNTDPVTLVSSVDDYLRLAGMYEHVLTNRLHFAVAGLLMRRRVTLFPNSYQKNWGLYQCWLRDLGCEWQIKL